MQRFFVLLLALNAAAIASQPERNLPDCGKAVQIQQAGSREDRARSFLNALKAKILSSGVDLERIRLRQAPISDTRSKLIKIFYVLDADEHFVGEVSIFKNSAFDNTATMNSKQLLQNSAVAGVELMGSGVGSLVYLAAAKKMFVDSGGVLVMTEDAEKPAQDVWDRFVKAEIATIRSITRHSELGEPYSAPVLNESFLETKASDSLLQFFEGTSLQLIENRAQRFLDSLEAKISSTGLDPENLILKRKNPPKLTSNHFDLVYRESKGEVDIGWVDIFKYAEIGDSSSIESSYVFKRAKKIGDVELLGSGVGSLAYLALAKIFYDEFGYRLAMQPSAKIPAKDVWDNFVREGIATAETFIRNEEGGGTVTVPVLREDFLSSSAAHRLLKYIE